MGQHPMAIGDLAQQLQPLFTKSLKAVWIIARSERAAAQHAHPVFRQPSGDGLHLLAAFHHAGSGHHDHLLAADGHVSHLDLRAFGVEGARSEFVRSADPHDFVYAFEQFQIARVSDARADRAEQRVARPRRTVNVETKIDRTIHDPDDLFLGRVLFHHYDHKNCGNREWGVGNGGWGMGSVSPFPTPYSPLPSSLLASMRSIRRASSITRSNMRRMASASSGPVFAAATLAFPSPTRS